MVPYTNKALNEYNVGLITRPGRRYPKVIIFQALYFSQLWKISFTRSGTPVNH